jgi:hypothetical protein
VKQTASLPQEDQYAVLKLKSMQERAHNLIALPRTPSSSFQVTSIVGTVISPLLTAETRMCGIATVKRDNPSEFMVLFLPHQFACSNLT